MLALFVIGTAEAQDARHQWSIGIETSARSTDHSGKLAVDNDGSFARAAFVYTGSIRPTLTVNAVVDGVDDGDSGIDLTEAFLSWRPVPQSPFRHSLKAGIFYPPLSLESVEPDWSSPYTGSFSAINTWIGEELRTIGTEWSVSRALGPRARQREFRFIAASYYGNDPAGALLAWRGWASHQRQSRLGDALVLPPVPQIQPGMMFQAQAASTKPFVEVDHAPGYYYGAEWQLGGRALLTAMHYDNHADPLTIRDGHYGWTTRFDHAGAKLELPGRLGLILQWVDGSTVMGPVIDGANVVDNGFNAWFALLTREHGRHRWSLRFDDFAMFDYDSIPLDRNDESGSAITAAWRFSPDANWSIGLEWRELDVSRPAFAYFNQPIDTRTDQISLDVRYRFSPGTR